MDKKEKTISRNPLTYQQMRNIPSRVMQFGSWILIKLHLKKNNYKEFMNEVDKSFNGGGSKNIADSDEEIFGVMEMKPIKTSSSQIKQPQ